ncbi:MAG: ferrous iron transport protein B [Anaerolineae bacterium]
MNDERPRARLRIALAGQPNVGKSTVFNMLTGLNQHVGNWPGKTVEMRSGQLEHHGLPIEVVDLPGAYCLTAASPEELVTRECIIHERPDVVMVVINASSLERNLYLVTELLALGCPLVIGLNMMDVARQEGFEIRVDVLAAAIGVPVVPMTAARGQGVHELLDAAIAVANDVSGQHPIRPEIRSDHREVLDRVEALIATCVPSPYPVQWVALKLLEGDQEITRVMSESCLPEQWSGVQDVLREHEDAIVAVASGRYEWIGHMARASMTRPRAGQVTVTQALDNIATDPVWGFLVLAAMLALVFGLTYALGGPLQAWVEAAIVVPFAGWLESALAGGPSWFRGLLVDGVVGGVGTMLTFLPILVIFFAGMGVLEDVGYMSRAAFVMDRLMHGIGLHGKSFIPLFLGFGCNVPAIMGTRIIESPRDRILTIMLAPLVPCTARLAVLTVLAHAFFPERAGVVTWALTALPLLILAVAGIAIRRWFLRGEPSALIMEMPLYHLPNRRTIAITVWQRTLAFLQKAGTVILAVSVIVWALSTYPGGDVDSSYMAAIGRMLEPVGRLMGLGWRPIVALLSSFVAKENAVATLGVLSGVGEQAGGLQTLMGTEFTPASALAFLVAQMLFVPCVSTLAVIRQETGSWKWVALNVLLLGVLTLLGGIIAYHVAQMVL